jgi:hypothetical protein
MWQLGSDNWISYGYGPSLSSDKSVTNDDIYIDFSKYEIPPTHVPAQDAAVIAVNDIINSYPGPYTLMCSGGVDSQSMIWCWVLSKVPFNIVSVRYVSNGVCFNEYDLEGLGVFAEANNLTVTYVDFDIINFLENDLVEISKKYDCNSPQFCTHIKMSECVTEGTLMFSGNYINRAFGISYTMLGLHRYAIAARTLTRAIIPSFFLHNPILAFSFTYNVPYSVERPADVYKSACFPVIPPVKKYNGFEQIKNYYDKYTARVSGRTKLMYASKPSNRIFDLLFRYPLHSSNINKSSRVTTIINKKNNDTIPNRF